MSESASNDPKRGANISVPSFEPITINRVRQNRVGFLAILAVNLSTHSSNGDPVF
jgi:hypothetical protein